MNTYVVTVDLSRYANERLLHTFIVDAASTAAAKDAVWNLLNESATECFTVLHARRTNA